MSDHAHVNCAACGMVQMLIDGEPWPVAITPFMVMCRACREHRPKVQVMAVRQLVNEFFQFKKCAFNAEHHAPSDCRHCLAITIEAAIQWRDQQWSDAYVKAFEQPPIATPGTPSNVKNMIQFAYDHIRDEMKLKTSKKDLEVLRAQFIADMEAKDLAKVEDAKRQFEASMAEQAKRQAEELKRQLDYLNNKLCNSVVAEFERSSTKDLSI